MDTDAFVGARLSIQQALLGIVTPELRAVYFELDEKEKKLAISFFYDGEVSDALYNLARSAIAKVDVPGYETSNGTIERLDFPHKIPSLGRWVYLRKECESLWI